MKRRSWLRSAALSSPGLILAEMACRVQRGRSFDRHEPFVNQTLANNALDLPDAFSSIRTIACHGAFISLSSIGEYGPLLVDSKY